MKTILSILTFCVVGPLSGPIVVAAPIPTAPGCEVEFSTDGSSVRYLMGTQASCPFQVVTTPMNGLPECWDELWLWTAQEEARTIDFAWEQSHGAVALPVVLYEDGTGFFALVSSARVGEDGSLVCLE